MAWAASPTITTEEEKWWGWHFMLIRGRWGLVLKEWIRSGGGIRVVTPGKWVLKNSGMVVGSASRWEK